MGTDGTMSTQTQKQRSKEQETQDLQQVNALVGKQVMETLGRPRNLLGVQVRQLWEDHYRVNVLTGADSTSVTVAHSYFLVVDSAGNILAATPRIGREY
jgi:hypothetical protein